MTNLTNKTIDLLTDNGILSAREADDLRAAPKGEEVEIESTKVAVTWAGDDGKGETNVGYAHSARVTDSGRVELWIGWDAGSANWHSVVDGIVRA